jgi:hypothetical protein
MSSWERGYGDMFFAMDLDTLRRTPGHPNSATIQSDLTWLDGTGEVAQSPRTILKQQIARAADAGYGAFAGTELEFILFEDSYDAAWDRRYHGLTGANRYNVDYSILGGSKVEPVLREIRNEMYRAGMTVESAKGECNFGQHEIGFLYDEVLRTCDNHTIYKTGAKEIAARHGQSLTFMAKYDEREGNSCHIHLSLRGTDGDIVFADDDRDGGRSELFDSFLAGVLATMREFSYFYAPNINSYKRFAAGSFAPTAVAWGTDNRTCACASSATVPGCAWRTASPEATSTPTSRWRRCSRVGCTASARDWPWSRRASAMPTSPTTSTCPRPWLRHVTCSRAAPSPASRLRRRGRRPLRQRRGRRTRGLQLRGDRLGTRPRLREAVTPHTMTTTVTTDAVRHDVINPATEQVVTTIDLVGVEETDAAVARAVEVGPAWRAVSPADRAQLLRRFADAVEAAHRRTRRLEVANSGHTIGNARWEAGNVVNVLRYYSAAPERLFGRQIPVAGGLDVTFKEPLGVVSVIVPWNFPMPIAGWGLGPGARGRQHRRPQTGRAHPPDGDPAR